MKKTLTIYPDRREHSQLLNALSVAIERFEENAKTFDQVAASGGNPFFAPESAKEVAKDFRQQAACTRMMQAFFAYMVEPFTIHAEEEEEEEAENPFHPESPEGRAWENGKRDF